MAQSPSVLDLIEQNVTLSTPFPKSDGPETDRLPHDAPLLAILAVNTVVTLVTGCLITVCVLWALNKRARRREERDKLGNIIRTYYWEDEEKILSTLQVMVKMRQNVIFRDVTELHILAYKYRTENGVYHEQGGASVLDAKHVSPFTTRMNIVASVKKIERLFESLMLQLPCRGSCPANIASAFSTTLYGLAHNTVLVWSDQKQRLIRGLVQYFAGRAAAEQFEIGCEADEELETIVLARIPYINQLYLHEDHYVIREIQISSDLKIDLRNKIRYIDTVLAKNEKILQSKEKNLIESYYTARDLCLKNNFIQNKHNLPDIVSKVGEASKVGECVTYLRHLLRIMCTPKHIKKVENDDKFFQFLMQLHETLYTWADSGTMLEVIERSRTNIMCYLRGLTIEQILMDKEFTKAKLEQVEKELYQHLNYLTLKQVQTEKTRRQVFKQQRTEVDPNLRSVDSEVSVYTMAPSVSSFMMRRQASQASQTSPEAEQRKRSDFDLLHQQASLDQSSIVSGSSVYATAASLSSGNEQTPLMGPSPPTPHHDASGKQSPTSDDYFETAV